MASNIPKIVIIGAGAAGIAAATRLLENGMNDLIVLEAENRIGGRIHSVEFDGSTVDLGGQWCHGQKGNIVYDLVKDLDLLSSSHNNYTDFSFYSSDGSVVDRSVTDRLLEILDEVADDEEAARKAKGTYGDYVTNEYRKRVSRLFGDNEQIRHMSEPLLNWFHKLMINLDPADSWFELSSAGPFYYKECEGDLYLQWRNKGFKTILDVLMVPFALNSCKISYKTRFSEKST
jgi:spermine oxidase